VTPPPPENHCRETGTDQQTVSDSPQPLPRNEKPLFKPVWSPTSMPEDPFWAGLHPELGASATSWDERASLMSTSNGVKHPSDFSVRTEPSKSRLDQEMNVSV
jgi:hypothetical protein